MTKEATRLIFHKKSQTYLSIILNQKKFLTKRNLTFHKCPPTVLFYLPTVPNFVDCKTALLISTLHSTMGIYYVSGFSRLTTQITLYSSSNIESACGPPIPQMNFILAVLCNLLEHTTGWCNENVTKCSNTKA